VRVALEEANLKTGRKPVPEIYITIHMMGKVQRVYEFGQYHNPDNHNLNFGHSKIL
jgi:hypothetical protein